MAYNRRKDRTVAGVQKHDHQTHPVSLLIITTNL